MWGYNAKLSRISLKHKNWEFIIAYNKTAVSGVLYPCGC